MRDPLKHYPYKEDTWRWGIPEPPKRSGWWIVAAIAALAIALALLLAGCHKPAPKSNPLGDTTQTTTKGVVEIPANAAERSWVEEETERMKDPKYAARVQRHWDGIHAAPREIAALKRRVAELEKRLKVAEAALIPNEPWTSGPIWIDQMPPVLEMHGGGSQNFKSLEIATPSGDFDLGSISMSSERHPVKRFHYAGGAWCNVWADAEGIHWEACK